MANIIGSITRAATRQPNEPLNILTFPTHERYETGLCKTGHNFYAWRAEGIKDWNRNYAALPNNYTLLNKDRGEDQIPIEVDIDLILSQNKCGQFQVASKLAHQLHLPLVSLEHTLPHVSWNRTTLETYYNMKGHYNVFISDYSKVEWGWKDSPAKVIYHGVDTELFSPANNLAKKKHVLSVVNDWPNRDWCCGFKLWQEVSKDLPVFPVGDSPGLSKPAGSILELVQNYREAQVFINTSLVSPYPTALLEAMSCGCAVVSTATCAIPEIIKNGENGFCTNDKAEMRSFLEKLLIDNELVQCLGIAARQTIVNKFGMDSFVSNWNEVFNIAKEHVYIGEVNEVKSVA